MITTPEVRSAEPARRPFDGEPRERSSPGSVSILERAEPWLWLLIAALVLWQGIGHTPFIDEMNHVLAAESLLEDGDLRIGAGLEPYSRGVEYTLLTALAFAVSGSTSLVAARLPAYLFGVLLVAAVFLWTRRHAGRLAAWMSATLLLLSPITLYLSQQARFYTFQALGFLLIAVLVQWLVERRPQGRTLLLLIAALALALVLTLRLQVTTFIGLVALGAWVGAVLLLRDALPPAWKRGLLVAAASGVVAVVGLTALGVEPLAGMWRLYRSPDAWSAGAADEPKFYFRMFRARFPVLLALLPAATLVALRQNLRFGALLAALFLIPVGIHSFGGWKSERYVFYVYPYFAILTGIGLAALVRWTARPLPAAANLRLPEWARRGVPVAGTLLVLGLLLLTNPAFRLMARMATTPDSEWVYETSYRGEPDWAAATPALKPRSDGGWYVVASSGLKAVYYLGRVDAVLMQNEVDHGELGPYPKLGVPALSDPESVRLLVACIPQGLLVIDEQHWGAPYGVPAATAETVTALMQPLPLPEQAGLRAFQWSGGDLGPDDAECAPLLRSVDRGLSRS